MKYYLVVLVFLVVNSSTQAQNRKDTLPLTLHFGEDKAAPEEGEWKKLDSFLAARPGVKILRIEGHTDTIGKESYNEDLSGRRSKTVAGYLYKKYGLGRPYPITNFGERKPVSREDNARNRRVDIYVEIEEKGTLGSSPDSGKGSSRDSQGSSQDSMGLAQDSLRTSPDGLLKRWEVDSLYFQPDVAILEPYSLSYIPIIAKILKSYHRVHFEIRGHVNCPLSVDPASDYMAKMNELSLKRARLIYGLLVDAGIPDTLMSYRGMGNKEMIYPNAVSDSEKRKNMRVEILVMETSSSKP